MAGGLLRITPRPFVSVVLTSWVVVVAHGAEEEWQEDGAAVALFVLALLAVLLLLAVLYVCHGRMHRRMKAAHRKLARAKREDEERARQARSSRRAAETSLDLARAAPSRRVPFNRAAFMRWRQDQTRLRSYLEEAQDNAPILFATGGGLFKSEVHQALTQNTHFTRRELQELHKMFLDRYPSGQVTRSGFADILSDLHGTPIADLREYANTVFDSFDSDSNGFITFDEYICFLSVSAMGTREEKLGSLFRIYDADNDGRLTILELTRLATAVYALAFAKDAAAAPPILTADDLAEILFTKMSTGHVDGVSEEEFIAGVSQDDLFRDIVDLSIATRTDPVPLYTDEEDKPLEFDGGQLTEDVQHRGLAEVMLTAQQLQDLSLLFTETSPTGMVTRTQFATCYAQISQHNLLEIQSYTDNVFRAFTPGPGGGIVAEEYICFMCLCVAGDRLHKMRTLFTVHEHHGVVGREHSEALFKALYKLERKNITAKELQGMISKDFDQDEFMQACERDAIIAGLIDKSLTGSDRGYFAVARRSSINAKDVAGLRALRRQQSSGTLPESEPDTNK